jgi:hypothetical protein
MRSAGRGLSMERTGSRVMFQASCPSAAAAAAGSVTKQGIVGTGKSHFNEGDALASSAKPSEHVDDCGAVLSVFSCSWHGGVVVWCAFLDPSATHRAMHAAWIAIKTTSREAATFTVRYCCSLFLS